jgi:zinc protease
MSSLRHVSVTSRVTRSFFAVSLVVMTLAAVAWASPVQVVPPRGYVVPYRQHQTTLPNGLVVVVIPIAGSGTVAVRTLVGVGARDEVEPGHTGFAHFFEHMMFRGTPTWPGDKRSEELARLGVSGGGYTTDDFTVYDHKGPKDALARVLELEADRFMHLAFTDDVFKTEALAVKGEYNRSMSDPDRRAFTELRDLAFDQHSYKHTALGVKDDIDRMPNESAYARRFFERFYTPDNTILTIAGDVDPIVAKDLAVRAFSSWKGTRDKTSPVADAPLTVERRREVAWSGAIAPRLAIGWRVPTSSTDRKTAALATVLSTVLFADAAPLTRALVKEKGLALRVETWFESKRDPSLFPVMVELAEGVKPAVVVDEIERALDAIARGEIDDAWLRDAKSHIRYATLLSMTSADTVGGTIVHASGHAMEPAALDQILVEVSRVERAELAAFVAQHFHKRARAVVIVTPAPATGKASR